MSSNRGVPLECTEQEAWQFYAQRQVSDANLLSYTLPEFDDDPSTVYQALREAELQLVPNENYQKGSAAVNNQLAVVRGDSGVLLTAEHATFHYRARADGPRRSKEPDTGTGALGILAAQETDSNGLVAVGRQTGDPNNDAEHPFKTEMEAIVALPLSQAHISLHGMVRGRAKEIEARRGLAVHVGIGDHPSDATRTLAYDYLVKIGQEYDLTVGVNQELLLFNSQLQRPRVNNDRTIRTVMFKGTGNTTRAFSEAVAAKYGKGDSFAAVQLELSDVLRCHPEMPVYAPIEFPTQRDRELGAYLGYLFVCRAVGSVALL